MSAFTSYGRAFAAAYRRLVPKPDFVRCSNRTIIFNHRDNSPDGFLLTDADLRGALPIVQFPTPVGSRNNAN
jgi:hypothetical protein